MTHSDNNGLSRRDVIKTPAAAAASALAGVGVPPVHAAENNTIQVALVGCGGRGTGAAGNALATKNGPIKLVAMADVFEDRLDEQPREPAAATTASARWSTCPRTASSSASTATRRRWTA